MKTTLLFLGRILLGTLLGAALVAAAVTGITAIITFILLYPAGVLLVAIITYICDCANDLKRWARR